MYIITVLPIKKNIRKEHLSYFSKEPAEASDLVKVPIRGKDYFALVISCVQAEDLKTEIRSSPFILRKIKSLKGKSFFKENWKKAIKKSAEYFIAQEGEILFSMIPSLVLENLDKLETKKESVIKEKIFSRGEVLAHQAEESERILNYKSAIREAFAQKSSVFMALPSNRSIAEMKEFFEKGIEKYTFAFFADMPKKEFIKNWKKASETDHPILVIGSVPWIIMPREDFRIIILEKENSAGWKTLSRPFLDLRKFIEIYARESGAKIILGDTVLRLETLWRYQQGDIGEFESIKCKIYPPAIIKQKNFLVEIGKSEGIGRKFEPGFRAVGTELLSLIQKNGEEGKNTFIYTVKKGLAPITICRDCGEEVTCNNCCSPVTLYSKKFLKNATKIFQKDNLQENFFRCHQCGEARSANEFCKKCGSWRLTTLGVGLEKVAEELKTALPKTQILQIQRENIDTAEEIIEKFYNSSGSILLGTEIALQYLRKPVDTTAVASIDPLFFVPDFQIREKIFRLILNIKLLAKETCFIQIRKAERKTLQLALEGNVSEFYKEEIRDREEFQYPPFSLFLKITLRGKSNFVQKESEKLKILFSEWKPVLYRSSTEKDNLISLNCVIKIPRDQWPNNLLSNIILSLPPQFEVKIDPDNLL